MNKTPDIHVIMPVYNCENFITDAVKSIVSQPYKLIHIYIVDDGSTDNTGRICDALAETYKNVIVFHKENGGVSSARNLGINYITENCDENDYIAFCDADDLWAKGCIDDEIFEHAEDIIVFQSCSISLDAKMCSDKHGSVSVLSPQKGGVNSIWRYPFHFGAFLYRVGLFNTHCIRFDESLRYNEDKVLLMQTLYLADQIVHFDRMLYLYRKNPSSAMHSRKYGIEYYSPLIDGWIRSDYQMRQYANDEREELIAGRILAIIYMVDAAREHYHHFNRKKELCDFLLNHAIYEDFIALDYCNVDPKNAKEHTLFTQHPNLFSIKHYALGTIINIIKLIMKLPIVAKWLYNREFEYPNTYF